MRSVSAAAFLAIALLLGCSDGQSARGRRVLVLGLDGLDHAITTRMLESGQLPNLARLRSQGGFAPLETTTPPQSPTAWSSFITGRTPGHHGIFDFVQRDPKTLLPYLSTSRVEEGRKLTLGCLSIPLGGGEVTLLRRERPFWSNLTEAGVPATVIKIPAHFPPRDDGDARVLTDMGTPDLLGTYGTFSVLSSDAAEAKKSYSGGRVVPLARVATDRYTASLAGPPDPMSACGGELAQELTVSVDREGRGLLVEAGAERVVLASGEWSGFVPLRFETTGGISGVTGIVRFYVKSIEPSVRIYVSPINIDPLDPALPVSQPAGFAAELARRSGRFYTQGMPEDTKALSSGVLTPEEFLAQARLVLEQRRRMFKEALADFREGFLFYYFGSTDQITHMFFRALDLEHPARKPADNRYAKVIEDVYREADKEVGRAMKALGPDDLLLVISDHGFGPAGYLFDLNGWLAEQGYLVLRDKPKSETLGHIDWERTQAYGLGLNGLYLNLQGREKYGVVPKERADQLMEKLISELQGVYHPETGQQVVTDVARPSERYPGPALDCAPDLIVGYNRGFKVAESSALGGVGSRMFSINRGEWSGDHCGDHRMVPGVLFANRPLAERQHSLLDLAPSVFAFFGLPPDAGWAGAPVLRGAKAAAK